MNRFFRWVAIPVATMATVFVLGSSSAPVQIASAQDPEGSEAVVAWDTDGNNVTNKAFLGTTNNKPLVFKVNKSEKMRLLPDGKIGIGTKTPSTSLNIAGANSRLRLESSANDVWTTMEYKADGREWHTGVGGSAVPNDLKNKFYIHDMTSGITRMVIDTEGRVGLSTWTPAAALEVANGGVCLSDPTGYGDVQFTETADVVGWVTTDNPNPDNAAFRVGSGSNPTAKFTIRNDGIAQLGALADATTEQLCVNGDLMIAACSSAAEYVPTIDGGTGYPEAADLVSIAPNVKNPYGDMHGPFAVEKSATACDANLLGYIVKPSLGANGVYLNDHYLPLAIFGYFPAKVSVENGAIKRGDPITSSSKAGYGMKATGACKVIGYALEDANADGTIQVFANYGDNSAAQVAQLQKENQELKQQLMAIETRLMALEVTEPSTKALTFATR